MRLTVVALLALVAGFASGMMGIAGGVILIPAFIYILSMKPLDAAGTTLAALLFPVGILAVSRYWQAGNVDVPVAIVTGIGVLIAAPFGAIVALHLGNAIISKAFGVVLIGVGISFLFR